MRLSGRIGQIITLVLFAALCAVVFTFLWVNSGGKLPGITKQPYRVTAYFPRVGNLVYFGDVMVAGVKIGKVDDEQVVGNQAKVVMNLTDYYPLHQGVTAQIRAKTLIEENFIELTDGTGPPLPNGTVLPKDSTKPPVELNDVLLTLDPKTRNSLADSLRSMGAASEGTKQALSDTVQGLGALGRGGHDALQALSAQSEDLRQLTGHTATTLAALNTQRGEIATLVQDANQLFTATADGQKDLADTMRTLPPVLVSARNASASLTDLGNALQPVARNLTEAAPDLTGALQELPDTSRDLRGLLPDLDSALGKAPDTLVRVPDTADDAQRLIPKAIGDLSDLNPTLGYIKPYSPDVAGTLVNFAQTLAHGDSNGNYFNTYVFVDEQSLKDFPVNTNIGPLAKYTPYMQPGGAYNPKGGAGRPFTRLQKEPPGR
ncbi:MAG TPA: MlaD family protein [Pseudonocardia sp.]|jgi:phospholipid/cholesterol/gamma-HCH transport system substrate-binding protein|uniref:MlaD family protein n=1 Tax=Pseudonocardia sp. TaxID=60912 RepID=UPI002F41C2E8